jgi:hypothetical protein
MARIVYADAPKRRKTSNAGASVVRKRTKNEDGTYSTIRNVQTRRDDFDETLHWVFKRNVEMARNTNKKVIGTRDRAPKS